MKHKGLTIGLSVVGGIVLIVAIAGVVLEEAA